MYTYTYITYMCIYIYIYIYYTHIHTHTHTHTMQCSQLYQWFEHSGPSRSSFDQSCTDELSNSKKTAYIYIYIYIYNGTQ